MSILKNNFLFITVFSIVVITYTFIRPVNIDEGYYIASAREVLDGKLPYKDIIFHQMPLTIYVYSMVSDLGYWSLVLGRALSVLMISLSFLLLLSIVKKLSGNNAVFIFFIFYFLNSFLIDWSVLIRIYALSIFLLSLGVFCFYRFLNTQYNYTYLLLSVFAFTLLVLTKVTFISSYFVLILFIILIVFKYDKKNIYKNVLITLITSAIPVIVFLLFFGKYLEEFYFNVFTVNFITKEHVDPPFVSGLLKYLSFFFLPQNLVLIAIIFISGFKYTLFEKFLILNIICFMLIHIPSRMLMEYLCSITPLLILLSCLRYQKFVDEMTVKFRSFSTKRIYAGLVLIYIISAPFSLIHLKNIIEGAELLMNPVQLYSFEKRINTIEGNTVLSSWEGYSIFSEKLPILKEQYGGAFINKYVGEKDILKYNLARQKDYENLIISKTPDIIIYDNSNSAHLDSLKDLICKNYNKAFEYKSVEVFSK